MCVLHRWKWELKVYWGVKQGGKRTWAEASSTIAEVSRPGRVGERQSSSSYRQVRDEPPTEHGEGGRVREVASVVLKKKENTCLSWSAGSSSFTTHEALAQGSQVSPSGSIPMMRRPASELLTPRDACRALIEHSMIDS